MTWHVNRKQNSSGKVKAGRLPQVCQHGSITTSLEVHIHICYLYKYATNRCNDPLTSKASLNEL